MEVMEWTEEGQQAFENLNQLLCAITLLALPTETRGFASEIAITAMLHQDQLLQPLMGKTKLNVIAYQQSPD